MKPPEWPAPGTAGIELSGTRTAAARSPVEVSRAGAGSPSAVRVTTPAHDTSGLDAATSSANNQAGWAGVGWRWSGSRTSYNADGLVSRANDYGDTAVSTDNTCDTTTHARDPVTWMLGFPAARETPAARWSGSSGPVTTP
ncbi:hypothetical protein [Planobispora longispora]|uniref:Uncharacterized protein n=1 Tax=Planobispora longispora TaxID=28887 RepID=A0A8J3RQD8_9ACTN|nr:hypothetical protein [Planobispora longispora]GIH79867.1 hypothetical protein Plo01_62960 [Planobispora longispora]